ncbi:endonuclease/exonuclease/phosphatase family protein [Sphingobacterium sp. DN00404]|uniref:Endonuclease/exonuclease/phosphatase family protein n=1 Tax=Sphingobacterium micropteri TaxID=2763501 RepID=A0ABR7YQX4_9SPHI|nr:endonuclease/exonuclease/phosphatase family protein [Sphingobacterium micropteri]MBD1433667.1 endonuclease/exonuclease/phosphatase family protein [Sphingobacterium micropteri]
MNKLIIAVLVVFAFGAIGSTGSEIPLGKQIKVLQINAWHAATAVPNGFNGLLGIIEQTDADIVLLSETKNHDNNVINKLVDTLQLLGKTYYAETSDGSAGLISKYPIESANTCCASAAQGSMAKAYIPVGGQKLVVYSAHLDYKHYECYLPRGYSGVSWKKIASPVDNADSILEANRLSERDESISAFLKDAKVEIEKGNLVLLGGDFNEPSHLDWQADTKDLRDHNGLVINWDCSVMLSQMGMVDSYRQKFPDAVKYPGFTFPSANNAVAVDKLTWAPEADERDRIDFIYYYPNSAWSLINVSIVGPEETVVRGKVKKKDSEDSFIVPNDVWPSDHKGNLATFMIE